jgi:hypothetical protein
MRMTAIAAGGRPEERAKMVAGEGNMTRLYIALSKPVRWSRHESAATHRL